MTHEDKIALLNAKIEQIRVLDRQIVEMETPVDEKSPEEESTIGKEMDKMLIELDREIAYKTSLLNN